MTSDAVEIHRLDDVVDLGRFLQARRARVSPEDVGLPGDVRRRVPGLRREELAMLAGVSVDYYTRLEQGRAKRPSDQVLDAVSRALGLDEATRRHLHRLAGVTRLEPGHPSAELGLPLVTMLEAIDAFPAMISDHRTDILAANRMMRLLLGGFGWELEGANFARLLFEDESRSYFPDWESVAAETVAQLRKMAALFPEDAAMASLIGELSIRHRRFSEMWAQAEVVDCVKGSVRFDHPMVGVLRLHKEQFRVADGSGQLLLTLSAAPGTDAHEKLRLLGASV